MVFHTAQEIKFFIKDFISKCDQMWLQLLKKSLMGNNLLCSATVFTKVISASQMKENHIPYFKTMQITVSLIYNTTENTQVNE